VRQKTVPVLSGAGSDELIVSHLARRFALRRAKPHRGQSSIAGEAIPGTVTRIPSQPEPGGCLVIVVRRLRRDFEATKQDGERHTVQRLIPESIVVVPVVAARSCAGVARDPWVTTRASPWWRDVSDTVFDIALKGRNKSAQGIGRKRWPSD
jgi:hypothetical protein